MERENIARIVGKIDLFSVKCNFEFPFSSGPRSLVFICTYFLVLGPFSVMKIQYKFTNECLNTIIYARIPKILLI